MSAPRSILFADCILVALCLVLAGCFSARTGRGEAELLQRMNSRQPYSLYLLASPHPRLYVEVDAVEGCVPGDADLAKLREFLSTCCNKPEGVELVRSDVISREAARGISPEALARKYINGPPGSQSPGPAFLYVLCYDNPLSAAPAVRETGHPALMRAAAAADRTRNPHVNLLLPTMIFMNMRYANRGEVADMLKHEAGHVLGLGDRAAGAAYYHCLEPTCLMYSTFPGPVTRLFLSEHSLKPRELCPQCLAQLAQASKAAPPSNLQFVGPVLVRREAGYEVLTLAERVKVVFGELAGQDCGDFAAAVHAETPVRDGGADWRTDWFAKSEVLREPSKLAEILHRAEADPYEPVRNAAAKAWDPILEAYRAHDEYTNAETLCHLRQH